MENKIKETTEKLNNGTITKDEADKILLDLFVVSDSDFIFNSLRNKLDEQEDNVVEYMNKYMTQEERDRHGDNIWGLLVRSQGLISQISLEMMADGRKIK